MFTTWSRRNPSSAYEYNRGRRTHSGGLFLGRNVQRKLYLSPTDWYFKRNRRKSQHQHIHHERKLHIVSYDHFWKHLCGGICHPRSDAHKISLRDLNSFSKLLIFFGIVGVVFGITTSITTQLRDCPAFRKTGYISYILGGVNLFFGVVLSVFVHHKSRETQEDINRRRRIVRDQSGIICNGNIGRVSHPIVVESNPSSIADTESDNASISSEQSKTFGSLNGLSTNSNVLSVDEKIPNVLQPIDISLRVNDNHTEETVLCRSTFSTPMRRRECCKTAPDTDVESDEEQLLCDSIVNTINLADSDASISRRKHSIRSFHEQKTRLAKMLSKSVDTLSCYRTRKDDISVNIELDQQQQAPQIALVPGIEIENSINNALLQQPLITEHHSEILLDCKTLYR